MILRDRTIEYDLRVALDDFNKAQAILIDAALVGCGLNRKPSKITVSEVKSNTTAVEHESRYIE